MSGQTNNLSASMPKLRGTWEKAGNALAACEFVLIRTKVHPREFAAKEGSFSLVLSSAKVPLRFKSLTEALRYSANQSLKDRGFSRSQKPGQGLMCEAGHWGVWEVSGMEKNGVLFPHPGGSIQFFQTVLPVPKAVAEEEVSEPKPASKKKVQAPVPASASEVKPAPKPRVKKPKAEPVAAEPAAEVLPEGISREGDKFRVGNLVVPSLEMAIAAVEANKAE